MKKDVDIVLKCIEDTIGNFFSDEGGYLIAKRSLSEFEKIIESWMKVHNIVSARNQQYDILENIYDSIVMIGFRGILVNIFSRGNNLITDAGAGGGFPGIPLAVILQNTTFNLVDNNRKKCSFLRTVKAKLKLINVVITNKDIREVAPSHFLITKAAFSPKNINLLADAIIGGGHILIWATPTTTDDFVSELTEHNIVLSSAHEYCLPSGKHRSLLLFTKS
jgi:16S rRNA (guanine(527)-N(7))-methyltransferase RsmG